MAPLVWYMYMKIALLSLSYIATGIFYLNFKFDENCYGGTGHVNGFPPPMCLPLLQPQLQVSRLGLKAYVV